MPEDKDFDKFSPEEPKEKSAKSSLEELILDTKVNRYQLVPLVLRWAKELEKHSEKKISPEELVNQALNDILGDKVKSVEITKLIEGKKK